MKKDYQNPAIEQIDLDRDERIAYSGGGGGGGEMILN